MSRNCTITNFIMTTHFIVLLILCKQIYSLANNDHCIWYGECGENPLNQLPYNCEYSGPPREIINNTYINMLKSLCPEYVDASGKALTCCDGQQIVTFYEGNLKMARNILEGCPSCWHNFRQFYCALTCSPHQSQFLKPLEIQTNDKTGKRFVTKVQFHARGSYVDRFYKSCQHVKAHNVNAMDMMCGERNHETCTSTYWLEYMGNNDFAPFEMQFNFSEHLVVDEGKIYQPLDIKTVPCNKPIELHGPACTCADCPDVCDNQTLYDLPDRYDGRFSIGQIDGMVFIAVIMFVLLMFSFLCFLIYSHSVRGVAFRSGKLSSSSTKETSKESLPLQDSVGNGEDGKSEPSSTPRIEKKQRENGVPHTSDPTAVIVHVPNWYQTLSIQFEGKVEAFFFRWGYYCAKNPFVVVCAGLIISSTLSLGILFFSVVTEPIELWAMPNSKARLEKEYFDTHFQPFYRTEHIIITPKKSEEVFHEREILGPAFQKEFLQEAWNLQKKIESLSVKVSNESVGLKDICFIPMAPDNNKCAVMSLFSYRHVKQDVDWIKNDSSQHLNFFLHCFKSPTSPSCLGDYGGPLYPYVTLGGFQGANYTTAEALVITILVNNYYDKSKVVNAMAWEAEFIETLKKYNATYMKLYFSSERSIQDELDRESRSDISTILISYIIMFCYISIGLGQATSCQRLLIDSKITLGLGGIILVIFSVMTSVGIFGFCGIPATLIVIEVVPFMCLAVGVDNIFILVQAFQRDERQPNELRENQIGRVVSVVAPSMFLSSITDACGFYLGAMSSMPAVQTFGLYAGTALLIAFFMQITCFVSLLSLDSRRIDNGKMDVCCWIQTVKNDYISPSTGLLYRIFKNIYSPFLMKTPVRIVVIVSFITWLCSSIAVLDKIEIGLDQELSMPRDSYMLHYFEALKQFLAVGPPVYFVIKSGYDYSSIEGQDAICSGVLCDKSSMLNELNFASHYPEQTYIAQEAYSWLDDYTAWSTIGSCCRENMENEEFCPSTNSTCDHCPINPVTIEGTRRLQGNSFIKYLNFFLKDNPSPSGCLGGHAAYSNAVQMLDSDKTIGATHFMTYHTILKSSKDYYEALWWARYIAERLTETLNRHMPSSTGQQYEVFPYSIFYVFYEQYLTIWRDTLKNLFYSLLTIFIMSFFLLGLQLYLAVIICITVSMIVINLMGMMYWWNIQLNAVSLVNLVVAVGIAVEFCSHISRAFGISTKETKILRTQEALTNMGSSVLCGITLTKFSGILVLYFAKSLIFQIFYFRINLCIVLFGAAHGLIFLPCLLSFFGPAASKRKLNEQQQSLLETQYRADETESTS